MNEFEPKDMPIFLNELARNFPDDDETRMKLDYTQLYPYYDFVEVGTDWNDFYD